MKSRSRMRPSKVTPRSVPRHKDEFITKQKRKPESRYVGPVEGAPARARLDRPSRRQRRASGGGIDDVGYTKLPTATAQGSVADTNDFVPINGVDAARSARLAQESYEKMRATKPDLGFARGGRPARKHYK